MEVNLNEKLVSICVVTYNSADTIIQTLNSLKDQTYKNIELILSDDASQDHTVQIINDWLLYNRERFVHVIFITSNNNKGVCINLAKSINASKGYWIKVLAGDDLLPENSITTFVQYANNNPNFDFFISNLKPFSDCGQIDDGYSISYNYLNMRQHKLFKIRQRRSCYILEYPGPGWFFSKKLYTDIGGLNTNYSMMDEWPFIIYTLQKGYDIYPIDKELVLYRVSHNSLSHVNSSFGRIDMVEQNKEFFHSERIPLLKKYHMFFHIWDQKLYFKIKFMQINQIKTKGCYSKKLDYLHLLSPVFIINKLKFYFFSKFKH